MKTRDLGQQLSLRALQARFLLRHPTLFFYCRKQISAGKTFLGYAKLLSLIDHFREQAIKKGAVRVAEFGVGRGGSAFVLYRLVARYGGHLTLYDVFGQIPPPTAPDGARAWERYFHITHSEAASYYGNVSNLRLLIEQELQTICAERRYTIVQGRYEDTLPNLDECTDKFDLVHIDCDWYESVRTVLAYLRGRLNAPATVQVDDWSYWEGARRAVIESGYLDYRHEVRGGALVIHVS